MNLPGVLFALLAGAAWAAYILLSARTGRSWPGLDGLAVASIVAGVGLLPFAAVDGAGAVLDARILALGALVGLLSSVVPYSLELAALRRLPPATFGILMSLEPAAAARAAMLLLREFLSPIQWLAMGCVVAASIGATRSGRVLGGTRARLTGERATRKPSVVAMAVVSQRDHRGVTAVWTSASGVLPTW